MRHPFPPRAGLPATWLLTFAVALAAAAPGALHAGDDALTLRINDTTAEPGGLAAVVLRTYASRGVGQGQIIVRNRRTKQLAKAASGPIMELEQAVIFSENGDTSPFHSFDAGTQTATVLFESPSTSVNLTDGPLAVLFFRLADDLTPGEEFELSLEAGTFLNDVLGLDIPVAPRSGTLRIRAPGAPYQLAAEGDIVLPGEVATLAVETSAIFPIWNGQVGFSYDHAIAAGPPIAVTMDHRYGLSSFEVDLSTPGLVVVSFLSANGTLNSIPGQIISIDLPTATGLPAGSRSPLSLDMDLTHLEDASGLPIPLALVGDELVLGGEAIFADGFESGDLSRW